jgi:hypothetical protein
MFSLHWSEQHTSLTGLLQRLSSMQILHPHDVCRMGLFKLSYLASLSVLQLLLSVRTLNMRVHMAIHEQLTSVPLCGWQLGPLPDYNAIAFVPHYLPLTTSRDDDARAGNLYLMSPEQAIELAHAILATAHKLQSCRDELYPL